jgi:hypothetical protein
MRRPSRSLLFAALVAAPLLPCLRPATGADAPPAGAAEPSAAAKAAARVRASIPAPAEPEEGKPSMAFAYEGDLVVAGENAGTVSVAVDVGTWRDQPVWLVTEAVVEAWAGSTQKTEGSYYLARDLSLLKGEWQRTSSSRFVRLDFRRDGETFLVTKEDGDPSKELPPAQERRLPAAATATFGRGAALLFLRYAPAAAASYELPVVPLDTLMPGIDEHEPAADAAPAVLEVKGPAKWGEKPDVVDAWMAVWRHGGRVAEWYCEPQHRGLIAVEQRRPVGVRIVPKGKGGVRAVYEDDQPATTWKACFLKFGHGYHMAVEKWLDGAFAWDQVHAHDVGALPEDQRLSVKDLRDAYVKEFVTRSKHRPREEADALLRMTLATAEQKTLEDGTVVLATHPEFGGNVFHFRKIGDEWKIVRIDQ